MSRSRKKTRYAGQKNSKGMKAIANRKVRRALKRDFDLDLSGKRYRKAFCSYDICDYYNIGPSNFEIFYKESLDAWYKWRRHYESEPPTREEAWQDYQRWYVRK